MRCEWEAGVSRSSTPWMSITGTWMRAAAARGETSATMKFPRFSASASAFSTSAWVAMGRALADHDVQIGEGRLAMTPRTRGSSGAAWRATAAPREAPNKMAPLRAPNTGAGGEETPRRMEDRVRSPFGRQARRGEHANQEKGSDGGSHVDIYARGSSREQSSVTVRGATGGARPP